MIQPKTFSKKLLAWSLSNPRIYPWSGEKDPYKIWISEIILQQTRTEQGKSYYQHFIKKYPNVKVLAQATEDQILNSWKGLGYYSRARNLHSTAKIIVKKFNAIFPTSISDIKSLKGIGEYSASAICSFAYNTPVGVVDGNVVRVFSRLLGIDSSFYNAKGKRTFFEIANKYVDKKKSAIYNQAIMNFGAIQCKPQQPNCEQCTFSKNCYAYQNDCVNLFPVKAKKIILKQRYFHFFLIENNRGEIAIRKRIKKDIWQKLYELPMIETTKDLEIRSISVIEKESTFFKFNKNSKVWTDGKTTQKLSHQEIIGRFYHLENTQIQAKIKHEYSYVKPKNLVNFAFPKILSVFLENINSK